MRVLLDECVDRRLAGDIRGHDVKTVPEAGLAAFSNGELLARAEHEFDAFVTVDRNLPLQQDLSRFSIAVIRAAGSIEPRHRSAQPPSAVARGLACREARCGHMDRRLTTA